MAVPPNLVSLAYPIRLPSRSLRNDVVLGGIGATTQALRQLIRTVPIVFAQGVDPVGSGIVATSRSPLHTADWAAALKEENIPRAETEKRWVEEEAARQAEKRREYEKSLQR